MSLFIKNSQNQKVLSPKVVADIKKLDMHIKNAYGLDIDITTLTTVLAEVREQKFYTVKISDFVPVRVGTGAWSTFLTSFTSEQSAGDFETGFANTSSKHAKIASVDVTLNPVSTPIQTWNKQIDWTVPELNYASKFGVWDIVESKEKTRKTNWDLGLQKIAFLGSPNFGLGGLLTASGVAINTAAMAATFTAATPAQLKAIVGAMITAYLAQNGNTAFPDTLVIPMSDWVGMSGASSENFPINSVIAQLQKAFADVTMNPNFKILPSPYASAAQSGGAFAKDRYVLYRNDADVLRMEIPVDYTMTMANTFNGYQFANVGFGQVGGTFVYRPQEVLYFQNGV